VLGERVRQRKCGDGVSAARLFDLTGRTALVTGAGQNVGAGIAAALAAHGATVAVNDLVAERAQQVVDEIAAAGGRAVPAPFDVTDLASVTAGVAAIGDVDILVNNAGNGGEERMVPQSFREMDPSRWEGPIKVNLYGVMNCCKAVIDAMCSRGWGRVITISSGAGTAGVNIGVSPYSAGKGGGLSFTRTLALEVASAGVTANTLAIGLMTAPDRTVTEHLAKRIPVGRTGIPQDIAAACVWLASNEAGWVTAQTIAINGGSVTT
jgi:NAD(P)-dependent dehydrogenase (short-subunit alcohol dehydrogenase family)